LLRRHGRYDYSGINSRANYDWPDGKRLAVYIGLNLEHFDFGDGLGAELAPGGPQPDVLNYAWRDYGNRVGAWRMLDLFDACAMPVSLLVNSEIYDYAPELVAAFRARGDEIIGHGRSNSERQGVLDEAAEKTLIDQCTAAIAAHGDGPAGGWLGPWISQSATTPDLLQEAGYRYLLDWCHDDQPVWMKTRAGRILSVPYPQEINDIPAIAARRASASDFADMIIDNFDEMLAQSSAQPLVMGIALHPYIMGQPFRLRHLRRALRHIADCGDERVWLTTAGAISDHIHGLPDGFIP
jgi:allantoinase